MPVAARRQLNDLPDELWTKINIEFYKDASDAVFKWWSERRWWSEPTRSSRTGRTTPNPTRTT
jgi:hypothetical protein